MGVRAPATITEVVRVIGASLHEEKEVNEGYRQCTDEYPRGHRPIGVIARTLRNRPYGGALFPC
ncbi:hypothetical protein GCM10009579_09680 [Streptomyces javensis]|uniref:Uncharacterized protein n=2 Tax=Streptomyces violaceusniger group TaxID=2839105 RepID=A0A4D4LE06_STRVO|nr:hypothetical protein SVIO_073410 [Streptomyces violaceusniger]